MAHRIWLFVAGLSGALAVIMGAVIKHKTPPLDPVVLQSLAAGQLYHILHSLALLGVAVLLIATEGRRAFAASLLIHLSGIAFLGGIMFFSFGIYGALEAGVVANARTVPVGGALFIAGWALLALSAFGLERARRKGEKD